MTNDHPSSQCEVTPASATVDGADGGGVTRRDVLALLAAFGVPSTALGANPPSVQDPVKIMPKSYRVAFENDVVRVLEYNNRPGMGPCGAGMHYHPRHIDIFLTPIRSRLTQDGKTSEGRADAGDVRWFEAETHQAESTDKAATRLYMVEIKDANWKPSTG
jgi:hypothetical protein